MSTVYAPANLVSAKIIFQSPQFKRDVGQNNRFDLAGLFPAIPALPGLRRRPKRDP
jgi:hypothetical protein